MNNDVVTTNKLFSYLKIVITIEFRVHYNLVTNIKLDLKFSH